MRPPGLALEDLKTKTFGAKMLKRPSIALKKG